MSLAMALLLVGPVPFVSVPPSKDLLLICGALVGFGYAQVRRSVQANDKEKSSGSNLVDNGVDLQPCQQCCLETGIFHRHKDRPHCCRW